MAKFMQIFMSHWSFGERSESSYMDIWKLSLALLKKHYKYVHLITDEQGYQKLKHLPFNSFIKILDNVPKYKNVWSLGKIYSYLYAANNGPFLHIDADVFLWEKLPERIINSNIFTQSKEPQIFDKNNNKYIDAYNLNIFKKLNLIFPDIWEKFNFLEPYNMGIFGGQDVENIKKYCDFTIQMINNKKYDDLWNSPDLKSTCLTCLIEQYNLSIFSNLNNLNLNVLIEDMNDEAGILGKYTHLMSSKENPQVRKCISERVSRDIYNLLPLN